MNLVVIPFKGTILYREDDDNWYHYKDTETKDSIADVIQAGVQIYVEDNLNTSEKKHQFFIEDLEEK